MSYVSGFAEVKTDDGAWEAPAAFIDKEHPSGLRRLFCIEALTPTWEMMFGRQAMFKFTEGAPDDMSSTLKNSWISDGYYSWIHLDDLLLDVWDAETVFVKMNDVPLEQMYAFADGGRILTWDQVGKLLPRYEPTFYCQEAIVYYQQNFETIKHREQEYARSGSVTWRMTLRDFVDVELKNALFNEIFEMSKEQAMRLVVVEEM